MTWAILTLAGTAVTAAGVALALAIRNGGLKGEVAKLRLRAEVAERLAERNGADAARAARELAVERVRGIAQLEAKDTKLAELREAAARDASPAEMRRLLTEASAPRVRDPAGVLKGRP